MWTNFRFVLNRPYQDKVLMVAAVWIATNICMFCRGQVVPWLVVPVVLFIMAVSYDAAMELVEWADSDTYPPDAFD